MYIIFLIQETYGHVASLPRLPFTLRNPLNLQEDDFELVQFTIYNEEELHYSDMVKEGSDW